MDDIINYVMDTPGNTNPNVLRSMLNNTSGGNTIVLEMMTNEETGKYLSPTFTWRQAFDALNEGRQVIAIERINTEEKQTGKSITTNENLIYLLMDTAFHSVYNEKISQSENYWDTFWFSFNRSGSNSTQLTAESADSPLIESN